MSAMRTRIGFTPNSRAHGRILAAGLALLLLGGTAPASAQYDPEPDEVIYEEAEVPSSAPFVANRGVVTPIDQSAWSNTASLYSQPPDPARCFAGVLRPQTRYRFLDAFNALRARHGLAPVRYNEGADSSAAEAALIMATNNALSHDPPPTWKCWTAAGAAAAGSSNLLGGVSSPYLTYEDDDAILAEWLIEGDGDEIGHRRWLLDPYLEETSLGRVITVLPGGVRVDSAVMKVFDFPARSARSGRLPKAPEFVAWPQGEYPGLFFSARARLSFSISQDPDSETIVDFSEAKIAISDGERSLPIRDRLSDNDGYGVANCLSWRVDGIVSGRTYTVTITGVRNAPRDRYSYTFRIAN
ncbi:hypothetical protein NSE01_19560 [Novosphingobium sediminis]|uniref:SCP domain-containing protein n=1 Tax=Novosphingobium sediminis TaxID=707214 RepID=A0A512AKA8_9SPHN|nr:CAP domain-containing protein [Novosphingobium sediminis]GEO00124.1 hypothetical protein NSE01_19560 [Novosphingobium sediminis]